MANNTTKMYALIFGLFISMTFTTKSTCASYSLEIFHLNGIVVRSLLPTTTATTTVFMTLSSLSLQQCILVCKHIQVCAFVNYNVRAHVCEILQSDNSSDYNVVTVPGYAYGMKHEWNMAKVTTDCGMCAAKERCFNDKVPALCKIQGCGPPETKLNTTQYGNRRQVDDKVLYKCNGNGVVQNGSVPYSQCQADGTWSSTDISCKLNETCVPPGGGTYQYPYTPTTQNTTHVFMISAQIRNKTEAVTFCNKYCGQLVQVYTEEKFIFIQGVIQSSTAYVSLDFWVDAIYNSTSQLWLTSSGQIVPNTVLMWSENYSPQPSGQTCTRIRSIGGNRLNGNSCSSLYSVICEQIYSID